MPVLRRTFCLLLQNENLFCVPRAFRPVVLALVVLSANASQAQQADSPAVAPQPVSAAAVEPLSPQIDALIRKAWERDSIVPAPLSSDSEFVRRIYLDLIGRVPNVEETRQFLTAVSSDKRRELIDDLLSRPEFARNMQHQFDTILMRRLPQKHVATAQWQAFLLQSFAENKPWDRLVSEILSVDGSDKKNRGPARFYLDREGDVTEITRDIARIFLGADLECAQCHNHPEIDDYHQSHYYGIAAFLTRSFVFTGPDKVAVFAEKAEGEAKFVSVFGDPKDEMVAAPRIFEGMALQDVMLKKGEEYKVKPAKDVRPIPQYSRRAQLAAAIADPQNPRFARTIANRIWSVLLGRGIIEPVELDHNDNPPSHPELLQLLSDRLVEQRFDLKWLIGEIVRSDTYQRSSRHDSEEPLPENSFGQFPLKPLTPEQLAWSMLEATGETAVQRAALADKLTEPALYAKMASYQNRFVQLFGGLPGKPPEDYESTVNQVLFLANDSMMQGLLAPKNGNVAGRLLEMPAEDPRPIVEELFLSVLSRPPTDEDVHDFSSLLQETDPTIRRQLVQDCVWALVTSGEFQFNH